VGEGVNGEEGGATATTPLKPLLAPPTPTLLLLLLPVEVELPIMALLVLLLEVLPLPEVVGRGGRFNNRLPFFSAL